MSDESNAAYERQVSTALQSGEFRCWSCGSPGPHHAVHGDVPRFVCSGCGTTLDVHHLRRAVAEDIAGISVVEAPRELPEHDTVVPEAPATLPVIPRGEAAARMRTAVGDLQRMVDRVAATGDALARALDEQEAG
jgi:hypothetical protein